MPYTVIRSYVELERSGITEKKWGTGVFITDDTAVIQSVRNELLAGVCAFRRVVFCRQLMAV